jgi:hypothetical protein
MKFRRDNLLLLAIFHSLFFVAKRLPVGSSTEIEHQIFLRVKTVFAASGEENAGNSGSLPRQNFNIPARLRLTDFQKRKVKSPRCS